MKKTWNNHSKRHNIVSSKILKRTSEQNVENLTATMNKKEHNPCAKRLRRPQSLLLIITEQTVLYLTKEVKNPY